MKNRLAIITIIIASAAMLLPGCDQTQEMGGKKVSFTARSKMFPSTKTAYSAIVEDNNVQYQRIDWQDGDILRIYSPGEEEGILWSPTMDRIPTQIVDSYLEVAYSDYKLREKDDNNNAAISVDPADSRFSVAKLFNNGDNGLTWTGNSATFYGAYPVDKNRLVPHALDIDPDNPGKNQHLLMEIKIPGAKSPDNEDGQTGDSTFVSTMPLLAKKADVTTGSKVELDFYPYFSAYEFNLWSKDQDVTINSLTLSAQEGFISGHYYWDLTAGSNNSVPPGAPRDDLGTPNTDADRTVTISGSWTATTAAAANIHVFGLPNDLGKITLTIKFTVGGSPATVKIDLGDNITFAACKKTRLKGLQIGGVWKIFIAAVGVDEWQEVGTTTLIML